MFVAIALVAAGKVGETVEIRDPEGPGQFRLDQGEVIDLIDLIVSRRLSASHTG